jgi:hypothetical protein
MKCGGKCNESGVLGVVESRVSTAGCVQLPLFTVARG